MKPKKQRLLLYFSICLLSFISLSFASADTSTAPPPITVDNTEKIVITTRNNISQKKQIRGNVKDQTGEPVIGAMVVENNNKSNGTVTDIDGNFSLKVSTNAYITISYMGLETQEVNTSDKTNLNIILKDDVTALEEVIVVGFGTQKKVNLTGSVASIDQKKLQNRPMTSVSAGIAGLLPGVAVTQGSGLPGADGGTIRIRGVGTLNNSSPLILVDGVESSMQNIDPSDIASLSVLKDAASASIYGSKAANGVILITTKRGQAGKTVINFTTNFGWQDPTASPEYMGSYEYATLYNEALRNDNNTEKFTANDLQKFKDGSAPYTHPDTDWLGLLYIGSGFQTTNNISVTGGTDKIRYMASVGYQKQDAVVAYTGKEQYNARLNLDANPTDKIEVQFNMSFIKTALHEANNSYTGGGLGQIFRLAGRISPWIPYKTEDGYYGAVSDGNPIAWMDNKQGGQILKDKYNFLGIGSVKYNILENFDIKAQLSYNSNIDDVNEFQTDIQYNPTYGHSPNKMHQKDYFKNTTSTDIIATYSDSFSEHNFNVLAGFHSELYQEKYTLAYRQNFPNNSLGDINGGSEAGMRSEGYTRELSMLSGFGRVTYDYAGKYLAEANVRYDGSSRFAKNNRWAAFPSFSAAWRITEEDFMDNTKGVLQNLKIRASCGKLGNQNAMNEYYPTIPTLNLDYSYPIDNIFSSGAATKYAKNPNLKWETTSTYGFGIDATLFSSLNLTLDYYNRKTTDILMEVPTPEVYALEKYIDNVGEINNQGVELSIGYQKTVRQVTFNVSSNVSYNQNEIKKLADRDEIIDGHNINRVGNSLNSVYGYEAIGLYQSQEEIDSYAEYKLTGIPQPGDLKYKDQNGDGVLNGEDRVVLGSTNPTYVFGLNLGVAWNGFDLNLFFQGAADVKRYMTGPVIGDFVGDSGKPNVLWRDRWTPENKDATVPRLISSITGPSMPDLTSSYWLQNADYVRLKDVRLGYTLPSKWLSKMGVSRFYIYYSGQNLLTFSKFLDGWDPEAPSGIGAYYPQVLVNSFGINLTF